MKIFSPVVVGLTGMTACLVALLLDMVGLINPGAHAVIASIAQSIGCSHLVILGSAVKNEVDVIRQLLLLFGAAFLFLAAMSKGKAGRLFQILEGALVIYGILSFIPMPHNAAVISRLFVSGVMFTTLWRLRLLDGWMNKIGASGLECLGMGYLFGSHWMFAVGGFLLTIFCANGYMKNPSLLDGLWTALNGPFAMASVTVIVFRHSPDLLPGDKAWLVVTLIGMFGGFLPFALIAQEKMVSRYRSDPDGHEWQVPLPGQPPILVEKKK